MLDGAPTCAACPIRGLGKANGIWAEKRGMEWFRETPRDTKEVGFGTSTD